MHNRRKGDLQGGLSWFLVAYLTMLLGVLLAVHALQPAWDGPGSASRSPVHRERQKAAKQPLPIQARQDRQTVDPSRSELNIL
jgi:hypothetical protein